MNAGDLVTRLSGAHRRRAPLRALLSVVRHMPGWSRLPYALRLHASGVAAPGEVWGTLPDTATRTVLIASHELTASGAPRLAVEVARACLARGWGVIVVTGEDGAFRRPLVELGAVVIATPTALSRRSPVFALAPHADALVCNTLVTLGLARRRPPVPTAWYLHETGLIDEIGRDAEIAEAVAAVDQLWASSPLVARAIGRFGREAVVVGGTGDPPPSTAPLPRRVPLEAVVLGGFEPRKGQLALAQAYTALPVEQRARLRITFHGRVVDPDYHAAVRAALVPGLADGGLLRSDAAARAVADADAAIVPSADEPLSLVAVDAMAAGRVVLCSRACGIADYLDDGVSGFVGADGSPDALMELLTRALANSDCWPAIGEAGRAVWAAEFAPDVYAARVADGIAAMMRPVALG